MFIAHRPHLQSSSSTVGITAVRTSFTNAELYELGLTKSQIRWMVKTGTAHRVVRGVYVLGRDEPSLIEQGFSVVKATHGVATGDLAGLLYGLDSISSNTVASSAKLTRLSGSRRLLLRDGDVRIVDGVAVTSPERTLIELASRNGDERWEQMLESALRMKLLTVDDILKRVREFRHQGNARVRRVVELRGTRVPPTESLLETLAIQLFREDARIPTPARQVDITHPNGRFVARVDLAFPQCGVFIELDGAWHNDQPTYDANRQTRVSAVTGWKVGRFTWDDITQRRNHTLRQMVALLNSPRAGSGSSFVA